MNWAAILPISRLLFRVGLYKPGTLKDDLKKRKQKSLKIIEKYPNPGKSKHIAGFYIDVNPSYYNSQFRNNLREDWVSFVEDRR